MKKTIYFHIGISKTGTTSLQYFCFNNRKVFEENGLLYPVIESSKYDNNGNCLFVAARDFCKGKYVKEVIKNNRQEFQNAISDVWKKIKKIIDESPAQKVLISSESFGAYPFVFWEFVDHQEYDVKLIVYLRNSFDHSVSYYKQHAKRGQHQLYSRNLIEFVSKFDRGYFYDIIEDYANYLGAENVIVRAYEKKQMKNGNTVDDIFDVIGFTVPQNAQALIDKNNSFSHDSTVIFNFIKMLLQSVNHDSSESFFKEFRMNDIGIQKTENLVSKEIIKEVCDKYYEKDCAIAKKFLGRDELFLDKYPPYYYQENSEKNSDGVMISYTQLNILYRVLRKAFEEKSSALEKIVNFIAVFIPSQTARQAFKKRYSTKSKELYNKISFADFAGSISLK